jgi:hypothetical protein
MKLSMPQKAITIISGQVDEIFMGVQSYIKKNTTLICALVILALCAYGFELFNFNLTIDEEIHATYSEPVFGWIEEGRWGMYLLNKFVIPYTVMPFVPLFIALVFHICAILLMLDAWQVTDIQDQIIVGAVRITFPILCCFDLVYLFKKRRGGEIVSHHPSFFRNSNLSRLHTCPRCYFSCSYYFKCNLVS